MRYILIFLVVCFSTVSFASDKVISCGQHENEIQCLTRLAKEAQEANSNNPVNVAKEQVREISEIAILGKEITESVIASLTTFAKEAGMGVYAFAETPMGQWTIALVLLYAFGFSIFKTIFGIIFLAVILYLIHKRFNSYMNFAPIESKMDYYKDDGTIEKTETKYLYNEHGSRENVITYILEKRNNYVAWKWFLSFLSIIVLLPVILV